MKIAMFTDAYRPQVNGMITSIESFTASLRALGHEVVIFAPMANRLASGMSNASENYKDDKFTYRFSSVPLNTYKEYSIALPYPLTHMPKNFDIVHIHSPFSIGAVGHLFAKHYGLPSVGTFHTLFPEYPHYAIGRLSKFREIKNAFRLISWKYLIRFYGKCTEVIAPSEGTAHELISRGLSNVSIIPNGIDIKISGKNKKNLRKKHGFDSNDKILLHVGRITKEKNMDLLIKSCAKPIKNSNFKLVITSDGPYRTELEKLTKKLGIENSIVFTGYLSKDALDDFYSLADVFIMASKTETQGMVLIEAALHKLPAAVLNTPVIGDFVRENNTGEVSDEKNFGKTIEDVYENRKSFEKSCVISAKKFDIKKCTKQMIAVYEKAIERHLTSNR
ncbi:MAG: glycosyltransferase [Candidatus Aenigmarchaeota archaeon]|nr:glycosyltransferase [Candidatus Aenigmarchaeota archaeon]